MKMQGFEPRFSQNLASVSRNKPLRPLPRLYFTFIQQTLSNYLLPLAYPNQEVNFALSLISSHLLPLGFLILFRFM
jgi:hypothetical protein